MGFDLYSNTVGFPEGLARFKEPFNKQNIGKHIVVKDSSTGLDIRKKIVDYSIVGYNPITNELNGVYHLADGCIIRDGKEGYTITIEDK